MESQETVALIGPWRAHVKKSPKVKPSWTRWLLLAPGASVDWLCLGPEGSGVASRLQSLVPSQALSPEVFLELEHPGETLTRSWQNSVFPGD